MKEQAGKPRPPDAVSFLPAILVNVILGQLNSWTGLFFFPGYPCMTSFPTEITQLKPRRMAQLRTGFDLMLPKQDLEKEHFKTCSLSKSETMQKGAGLNKINSPHVW